MSATSVFAWALFAPLLQGALVGLLPRFLRDGAHVAIALAVAAAFWGLFSEAINAGGPAPTLVLAEPIPGARLAFAADPLGLFCATVISTVAAMISCHAIGFLRATQHGASRVAHLRALAAASGAAVAIALADTLFTLMIGATALSLAGAAVLARNADAPAAKAAGLYLAAVLCGALGLLLPAAAWTHGLAGDAAFAVGGLLAAAPTAALAPLLALYVFGLAGASLAPLHRGLTATAAANAPAAGMVFAVAAPAGMAGLLKVSAFVFGTALWDIALWRDALGALAHISALFASVVALSRPDLKDRLAYLCVAQLGLIAAGALEPNPAAAFGAALHLASFALGAAVLFMAAGAVEAATGRRAVAELSGLGRQMPFTFAAFAVGVLAFSGVAPMAGAWSRLWLTAGAEVSGDSWAAWSILATGALAFAALGPITVKALFAPAPNQGVFRPDAGTATLVAPIAITAMLLVGLVLVVEPISQALWPALETTFARGATP